jgi:hypothetical protein
MVDGNDSQSPSHSLRHLRLACEVRAFSNFLPGHGRAWGKLPETRFTRTPLHAA